VCSGNPAARKVAEEQRNQRLSAKIKAIPFNFTLKWVFALFMHRKTKFHTLEPSEANLEQN